jgi:drug/metabolite transporter (DMT)-like permease
VKKENQAYVYAVLSVLLWSTVASAFKVALRYLDFLQLLFYASLTSLVVFFLLILFQKKLPLLLRTTRPELLNSAILGFINPFTYYIVLFSAYSKLLAQQAQALNYTWPVMLVLLSIPLLKQKIDNRSILAILISFSGVVIVSTQANFTGLRQINIVGILLGLGSAAIWAVFWIFNQKDQRDEAIKFFLNFTFGFFYIFLANLATRRLHIPGLHAISSAVYVGLFEMGITFIIWARALSLARNTAQVSNLIYLNPFISLIIISIVVGETITIATLIGLIIILGGVLLQHYRDK